MNKDFKDFVERHLREAAREQINQRFTELMDALSLRLTYRACYVVTASDVSRGFVKINTTLKPKIHGRLVQVYSQDGETVTMDAVVTMDGEYLLIENGPEIFELREGDTISWVCW